MRAQARCLLRGAQGGMSVIDQPTVIEDRTFLDLVSARARRLLGIVLGIERLDRATVVILSRPLLGVILEEATMLEELLDAYDARNNSTWFTGSYGNVPDAAPGNLFADIACSTRCRGPQRSNGCCHHPRS